MILSRKGRRLAIYAFSATLAVQAFVTTSFWTDMSQAFLMSGLDYDTARSMAAFKGVPMDQLGEQLDRLLPPDASVSLDPQLMASDFISQRFTEGLYPRPVEAGARNTIVISGPSGTGTELTSRDGFGRPLEIRLTGELPKPAPQIVEGAAESRATAHPFLLAALGAIAIVGLGLAALEAARLSASFDLPSLLAAGFVTASLILALVSTASAWIQVPFPRIVLAALGILALGLVTIRNWRKRPHFHFLRRFENGALGALFASVLFRFAVSPISLWDGRSIWYFQAKRLFTHGMLTLSDLKNVPTLWSHPDYPLLLPSWLSMFGGLSALHFNESQAALGNGLLTCALLALLWFLARTRLGRWPGAAFVLAVALATDRVNVGGYADGLLLLMLLSAVLARLTERPILFWILLAAASLTKTEGLVLAGCVAAPLLISGRPRVERGRQLALRALAVGGPALLHRIWIRTAGVDSFLKGGSLADAFTKFGSRLLTELSLFPRLFLSQGYTHVRGLIWAGAAGAALLVALRILGRARLSRETTAILGAAALASAFAFVSIALLPESVEWFVGATLDRLLLLPAALLILAPLESNVSNVSKA